MSPKLRKYLILAHLWIAGLMAPAFALHAVSGGLYLVNVKGTVSTERLSLPENSTLDFKSETLESDVRALLSSANIQHEFEYIRNRGTVIQLRPTSKTYLEFAQTPQGLSAKKVRPDTVKALMELHMGHGPQLFKTYQKIVAVLLLGVIFGGILVGLMAKAYRNQTIIAVIMGSVVFALLGFIL